MFSCQHAVQLEALDEELPRVVDGRDPEHTIVAPSLGESHEIDHLEVTVMISSNDLSAPRKVGVNLPRRRTPAPVVADPRRSMHAR